MERRTHVFWSVQRFYGVEFRPGRPNIQAAALPIDQSNRYSCPSPCHSPSRSLFSFSFFLSFPFIHLVWGKMQEYKYELHQLLDDEDLVRFTMRWNLFKFKLDEVVEFLSMHDWYSAYIYTRSAYKDSEELLNILTHASNSISSILQCHVFLSLFLKHFT